MSDFEQQISECERRIAYTFTDKLKLAEALNLDDSEPVYVFGRWLVLAKNENMARYGRDMAVRVLKDRCNGAGLSDDDFNKIRWDSIDDPNLIMLGVQVGVGSIMKVDKVKTPLMSTRLLGETIKAIMGAVHLDGGNLALIRLMQRWGLFNHKLLKIVSTSKATTPAAADEIETFFMEI